MSTTIARLYRDPERATAAAEELRHFGFSDSHMQVVSPPETQDARAGEAIMVQLRRAEVVKSNIRAYAEGVRRGGTLVMVRAPYGTAANASSILDRFEPERVGVAEPQIPGAVADPAAPLSAAMGWRVLINNPTPLSTRLGLSVLSERQTSNTQLFEEPAPLSRLFGWRVLIDNPAPLSTRLGWRLLSDNITPISKRFGWRVLSDNPTPLSTRLGLRVLSERQNPTLTLWHNPAPFSALFGWRVLIGESPAP